MNYNQQAFYNLCVEILDNENGVSSTVYYAMLNYAENMQYYHTADMLRKHVDATDNCYYLPEGFARV